MVTTPAIIQSSTIGQTQPPKPQTYQVQPGDNLSQLARSFCGNSDQWKKFVMNNEFLIGRQDYLLNTGEILSIPTQCKTR